MNPPQADSNGPIKVLAQTDAWVAVSKPAGLLSVPGKGAAHDPLKADCAVARAQLLCRQTLFVVHRLDQPTSGILLLATSKAAERHLSLQFQARTVGKRYEALVQGHVLEPSGTLDLPLICDWPNRPKQMVDHTVGKPSQTLWQVLERDMEGGNPSTRLSLVPLTGRSHQLRVHCMAMGHAILGDTLYEAPSAPRLMLHAAQLAFVCPHTGERITLQSDVPF